MFQLLNPFWLIALAGITLPIAIHLWNKRPGRTIKVGSIRWMEAATSQRLSSIRLQQWALLLLRVSMVALAALLLTQPQWLSGPTAQARRQVYVSPDLLRTGQAPQLQRSLDSLRRAGYEVRQFSPGFPVLTEQKITEAPKPAAQSSAHYWQLLLALNNQSPRPREAWIFTSNSLADFRGERPAVAFPVTWITMPVPADTAWLQAAFRTNTDSLALTMGYSGASGTYYHTYRQVWPTDHAIIQVPGSSGKNQRIAIKREGDRLLAQYAGQSVPVQQRTERIAIVHTPDRNADARYVQAALEAYAAVSGRRLQLQVVQQTLAELPAVQWVFWLSDQPLPPHWRAVAGKGTKVFRDAPTEGQKATSGLLLIPGYSARALYQVSPLSDSLRSTGLWKDAAGYALLSWEAVGKGGIYTFASRFHPTWNELPETPDFAAVLGDLIWPGPDSRPLPDLRAVDELQIQPRRQPEAAPERTARQGVDLTRGLALLLLLLFALERALVQMRRKPVIYSRMESRMESPMESRTERAAPEV